MTSTENVEEHTPEQLQELIKIQKDNSAKLQQQVETMKLRNQLEAEQMQQQQWELAIKQLKQSREQMAQQHEENMAKTRNMTTPPPQDDAVAWMKAQLVRGNPLEEPDIRAREELAQKKTLLEKLHKQQEEIHRQIGDITGEDDTNPSWGSLGTNPLGPTASKTEQELLWSQIRASLAPKGTDKDPNKALLKALIMGQNKTTGHGGTSTLKLDVLTKLAGDGEFSMAEWLATLNKQEEGESEISKLLNKLDDESDCRPECKHSEDEVRNAGQIHNQHLAQGSMAPEESGGRLG